MTAKKLAFVLALSSLAACGDKGDEQSRTRKLSNMPMVEQRDSSREAGQSVEAVNSTPVESVSVAAGLDARQTTVGRNIYWGKCMACHAAGVAGAPKVGDARRWQSRIAQGIDQLYTNAINGFRGSTGYMPPKGGYTRLSDDDVRAAVAYMVSMSR